MQAAPNAAMTVLVTALTTVLLQLLFDLTASAAVHAPAFRAVPGVASRSSELITTQAASFDYAFLGGFLGLRFWF